MILVSEFCDPAGLERLRAGPRAVVYDPELWRDREALAARLDGAEALIVRNQTQIDAALLARAPRLRAVGRLGVGLDNLDLEALKARGAVVVDARGANAAAVAEYVLAALFLFARRLSAAAAHVAGGGWERSRFGGGELGGKTLGLVGLGDIGLRVAWRARALGMRVCAADPARSPAEAAVEESGIALKPLDELLGGSDFVSLHAPLHAGTRGLLDADRLALIPAGACLINTARGRLVDHAALARRLRDGELAGAVLDVVDPEPLPADHPLRKAPNAWITPHVAGLTAEAQRRVGLQVAEGVLAALAEGGA